MQTPPIQAPPVLDLSQRRANLEQEIARRQQALNQLDNQRAQTSAEMLQMQGALQLVRELEAEQAAAERAAAEPAATGN